jgi:two-component system OmpR family response regulator
MKLLLLEDDVDLGQAVAEHLLAAGHEVHWCKTLAQAAAPQAVPPALALLDLQLPDGDGLDLLRRWRAEGRMTPVIVLTARDQVSDRIRGLRAGADDYLVKPFDLDELLARVAAVARRGGTPPRLALAGRAELDTAARQAWHEGVPVPLTAMEWTLLAALAAHPGRVCTRGEIEQGLAADGFADADSNVLEVIISRLRRKLGAAAIATHRGLGYALVPAARSGPTP